MALGSQALSQAEIDKQKAANKDITNWKDNIIGDGTDQGSITASGDKKATRKVEKMADNKYSFFNSFNNPKDISMGFNPSWDIDGPEFKAYVKNKGQKLGYRDKKVNLSSSWNTAGVNNTQKKIINNTTPNQSQSQSITNNVNTGGKSTTTNTPASSSSTTPTSSTGYTGNNPNAGQWQKQNVTNNINISGLGGGSGGGGSTGGGGGPTNPAGGIAKNMDAMLGRQPKANTFKKTTGLTNNQPGGKTPYKFRGLENQFQSWQMQHYNNDTTT